MYKKEKKAIILWAKRLYEKGLVEGASGNISLKLERNRVLITTQNSYLGYLEEDDLVVSDLKGNILQGDKKPTSELKLHLHIHKNFNKRVVLHAHPAFTTLYFSQFKKLKTITFEPQVYLKDFKVIPQKAYNVLDTKPVIKALTKSNIVVLKNHGVVSLGQNFKEAFSLIEILEKEAKLNTILKYIHG